MGGRGTVWLVMRGKATKKERRGGGLTCNAIFFVNIVYRIPRVSDAQVTQKHS